MNPPPPQKKILTRLNEWWSIPQFRFLILSLLVFVVICLVIFLIEKNATSTQISSLTDAWWWGIVTFTTNGYGDKVPQTQLGKVVASFTMIWGVLVMGVVSGTLAGYFVDRQLELRKGKMDLSRLRGHFIICGWKKNMPKVLGGILEFNSALSADSLVIITNIGEEAIDEVKSDPRFANLNVVRGDYFSEAILRLANPGHSKKIIILADQADSANTTDSDSRTVMTAMILNSHWKGLDICAEILDEKFDQYLKLANVNEIIYSREYSTIMLANSVSTTGIAGIVFDLLDPTTGSVITPAPFRNRFLANNFAICENIFRV